MIKKVLFVTGTRADYGKIKSLMSKVAENSELELLIFVTGMHMLSKYGLTYKEIEKDGFTGLYKYINQTYSSNMDIALSNTILGISNYISEEKPDLIVVHGDRIEALAGAMVGALNNILVAHVEGGEVSGTIDESIRHAISKFSHLHFVANEQAKKRIIQLGEPSCNIFIIGSPDIDLMLSKNLPSLAQAQSRYEISFDDYVILMYHPVTTELDKIKSNIKILVDSVIKSEKNFIVIFPNNDSGSDIIIDEYARFQEHKNIRVFPSIKFEYFLTFLKSSKAIIGNSSAGIREAAIYGVPAIDIGTRQNGRYSKEDSNIFNVKEEQEVILKTLDKVYGKEFTNMQIFGDGNSSDSFIDILTTKNFWQSKIQKKFNDME